MTLTYPQGVTVLYKKNYLMTKEALLESLFISLTNNKLEYTIKKRF